MKSIAVIVNIIPVVSNIYFEVFRFRKAVKNRIIKCFFKKRGKITFNFMIIRNVVKFIIFIESVLLLIFLRFHLYCQNYVQ